VLRNLIVAEREEQLFDDNNMSFRKHYVPRPAKPVLADPVHFDRIRIRPLKKTRIRIRLRPKAIKYP
jgi:hypothetical protein